MNVKIISVGTEVLTGQTINTNAAKIALEFLEKGFEISKIVVIGDDKNKLTEEMDNTSEDIVIFTGGLGPTVDDFTKEVVCEYLGIEMVLNNDILNRIKELFRRIGSEMSECNVKQAYIPKGGIVLSNENGSAPGCLIKNENQTFILLPGPPKEMEPMLYEVLDKHLSNKNTIYKDGFKLSGIGESTCEGMLNGFYEKHPNVYVAPYALDREIKYMFTSNDEQEMINCMQDFKTIFDDYIIGDYNTTLVKEVVRMLEENGETISFAESCTGGLAAATIVSLPGASKVFNESLVTYSYESKTKYLGVSEYTLAKEGAISEDCVTQMVDGLRELSKADVCVAISGIAGPTGGTPAKPVGTVFIAVKYKNDTYVYKNLVHGDRMMVRTHSVQNALYYVYKLLRK